MAARSGFSSDLILINRTEPSAKAAKKPSTSALRPKLVVQGFEAAGTCGADFAEFLDKQVGEYGRIIREANIKPE